MQNLKEAVQSALAAIGPNPLLRSEIMALVPEAARKVHEGKRVGNALDHALTAAVESGDLLRDMQDGRYIYFRPNNGAAIPAPAPAPTVEPTTVEAPAGAPVPFSPGAPMVMTTDPAADILEVVRYRTPDGQEHATRAEAAAHWAAARRIAKAKAFIAKNWSEGHDIPEWLPKIMVDFSAEVNF